MRWLQVLLVASLGGMASTVAARAEYLISSGDVLELSVVGVPELQHRATVTPEGLVAFPLIDDLQAEGRSLAELREELRAKLSQKGAPRQTGAGIGDTVAFAPDQINLVIAEYRPIYVNGHVATPGEQRFRIGMTAREAIAVAGGYGLPGREEATDDAQTTYGTTLNELAREQVRLMRLQAEHEGVESFDAALANAGSVAARRDTDIVRLEREQFEQRAATRANERKHLERSIASLDKHLAILRERRTHEVEALASDQGDFDRINDLFKRGMTVSVRVSEARRSVFFSATQLLQTDASIATAEREALTLRRELARLDEERRLTLAREMQEATLRIQNLQTTLMFTSPQISLMTGLTLVQGDMNPAKVLIVRRHNGSRESISGDLDTELMPGDVVEVTLLGLPVGAQPTRRRAELR